jgi:hypothetical protein
MSFHAPFSFFLDFRTWSSTEVRIEPDMLRSCISSSKSTSDLRLLTNLFSFATRTLKRWVTLLLPFDTHGKDSCWIVTLPSGQKSDWEWLVNLNIRHRPGISKRRATSGGQSANLSPDIAMPLYGFNPFSFINTYNYTGFEAGGLGCAMYYPALPPD